MFRRRGLLVLSLLAVVGALAVAPPAGADSRTPVSLTSYADMVVDADNGQVFVSGGSGNSSVVVLDLDGHVVTTIGSQPGAASMVLDPASSTLYVALRDSNAISEISTATLTETDRISVAPNSAPYYLALAGGRLWFSHDCGGSSSGMSSILPDGSGLIQYPRSPGTYPYYCPSFATSPTDPDLLVATDVGISPPKVYVFDVSSAADPLTLSTSKTLSSSGDFDDMVVSPDGSKLFAAAGAPYSIQVFALSDLSSATTYPTGPYPNSVAITDDGSYVAGGRKAVYDPDLYIFPAGSSTAQANYEFTLGPGTSAGELYPRGLAFSPDASLLFAATKRTASSIDFRILLAPTVVRLPTTVSIAPSKSTTLYNKSVTLTAHVGPHNGGGLSIYATPYNGTRKLLKIGSPNSSGNLSVSYTLKTMTTFTAEYSGDATYAPKTSAGKVVKVHAIAKATLSRYYGTSGKYKLYHAGVVPLVKGAVTPNHAGSYLTFVGQRYVSGAWRTFDSAGYLIGSTGTVSATLLHASRGSYRVRTIFPGDIDHLGGTSPWRYLKVT